MQLLILVVSLYISDLSSGVMQYRPRQIKKPPVLSDKRRLLTQNSGCYLGRRVKPNPNRARPSKDRLVGSGTAVNWKLKSAEPGLKFVLLQFLPASHVLAPRLIQPDAPSSSSSSQSAPIPTRKGLLKLVGACEISMVKPSSDP